MNEKVEKAVEVLRNGGIVLLPTDTVFGLCCRIDNEKALERLFQIKKRELSQAVPILVSSTDMVKEYVKTFSKDVEQLMETYWPGGLTIVLPCKKDKVLPLVRGKGDTVGVRIPDMVSPFQVIEKLGVPIVGTSANLHGEPAVSRYKDLDLTLKEHVDYVFEENSLGSLSSTVIDCTVTPWKILRKGAVILSETEDLD